MIALTRTAFVLALQFVAVIGFAAQHSSGHPSRLSVEAAGSGAASTSSH